ncbi:OLC1v1036272C1 [Oldenlandia corymbosa var. corymbosa]|uniref:OLC1v1036272C1 n=1 Tax=Oldenlandia corymbosa var. corymbosa TaxID=529605 RepID=A0AAV1CUW4_OLDCO|nr:OLC1v1036272C1 [Oldenlandia corymbosa var. corymbosa]
MRFGIPLLVVTRDHGLTSLKTIKNQAAAIAGFMFQWGFGSLEKSLIRSMGEWICELEMVLEHGKPMVMVFGIEIRPLGFSGRGPNISSIGNLGVVRW